MFVSWIRHHGRSASLASALGIPGVFIATGRQGQRLLAPLRYVVQTVRTVWLLIRRRPAVLYVMAPPAPLVVIGLLYQTITRRPLVVDAHTSAVLSARGRPKRLLWLARGARVTLVTTDRLAEIVAAQHVRVTVVGDPPLAGAEAGADGVSDEQLPARPTFVMPCSWFRDEPLEQLLAAAELTPEVDVVLTGQPPANVTMLTLPANVRLSGWLETDDFIHLLRSATGVLALTTREFTMQRAGYEAMIHGKPLVVSDTAVLRDYFTKGAVFAAPDARSLSNAMRACQAESARLGQEIALLRFEKEAQFHEQLRELAAAVR